MPLFFGLYGKNEAVEWNCQKKHQFLDSHRSGEKYKKSLQILLFPLLLPKVHKLFLNWGKQDYLLEGTMVRNCLFFQTSEWELRQFWSFRGTWGRLNITFTVSINNKQKAPVEIHSFDLKWKELLACLGKVFMWCKSEVSEMNCQYLVNCKEFSGKLNDTRDPEAKQLT